MNDGARRQPGAGLGAIFRRQDPSGVTELTTARLIPVALIEPNPAQPRTDFDPEALDELAASLRDRGVLQALLVRPLDEGRYQLISGERRWRAAQLAGLTDLPCIVRTTDDAELGELALIENVQRRDLSAVEEGHAYRRLMGSEDLSLRQVAERVRRSHEHVARRLRVVEDPQIEEAVRSGALGATVGAELARAENAALRPVVLERVAQGLPVTLADLAALAQAMAGGVTEPELASATAGVTSEGNPDDLPDGMGGFQHAPATAERKAEREPRPQGAVVEASGVAWVGLPEIQDQIERMQTGLAAGEPLSDDEARSLLLSVLRADLAWLEDLERRAEGS